MPEKTDQQQPEDVRAAELATWAQSLDSTNSDGQPQLRLASEDASFRRYFRHSSLPGILADMPHSENPDAFTEIAARLACGGLNVPRVHARDHVKGFLWLTDLGTTTYLYSEGDRMVLYRDAVYALLRMQQRVSCKDLPQYDSTMLMCEMNLFRDWLLRSWLDLPVNRNEEKQLTSVFTVLCEVALAQPQLFVHRDYHSRNLMHCPENNPGILDFQDAVCGPYTYDLVSLLKDCYIRLDEQLSEHLCQLYLREAKAMGILQSEQSNFQKDFDFMGVQRHLKAAGIFVRLYLRDNKKSYLADIPRTLSYITGLHGCYPELDWLAQWLQSDIVPRIKAKL